LIKRISARINGLNVRERFLLFAVTVSILGGATDYFFITPLVNQQKALVAQLDQKSTDMDVLREKVNAEVLQRNLGRAAELAVGMRETKAELDAVDAEIASLSAAGADPLATSALVSRVLKRSDQGKGRGAVCLRKKRLSAQEPSWRGRVRVISHF